MTSSRTAAAPAGGRALHVALWVAQVLLALGFGMAGFMKLTQPVASLSAQMPWTTAVPTGLVRFIGLSELSGALGLILPAAARVLPRLTPAAATGLVLIMGMAAAFHLSRGEITALPINGILGALAAFVAWGRFVARPIAPRA